MKCDKCSNYQPHPSGFENGYYKACKSLNRLSIYHNFVDEDYIQEFMDGKRNYCEGFKKI